MPLHFFSTADAHTHTHTHSLSLSLSLSLSPLCYSGPRTNSGLVMADKQAGEKLVLLTSATSNKMTCVIVSLCGMAVFSFFFCFFACSRMHAFLFVFFAVCLCCLLFGTCELDAFTQLTHAHASTMHVPMFIKGAGEEKRRQLSGLFRKTSRSSRSGSLSVKNLTPFRKRSQTTAKPAAANVAASPQDGARRLTVSAGMTRSPSDPGTLRAADMRMTDKQRVEVMTLVKDGAMTVDEAFQHMIDIERKLASQPASSPSSRKASRHSGTSSTAAVDVDMFATLATSLEVCVCLCVSVPMSVPVCLCLCL